MGFVPYADYSTFLLAALAITFPIAAFGIGYPTLLVGIYHRMRGAKIPGSIR